jgi:hypothetical protein
MLDKATRKRVNDEMDMDDFKRFKASLTKETADLKMRISGLKESESGFMEYLRYGIKVLGNLSYYYNTAKLENKQKIVGSIFPEKLIYSENTYRTAQPNEIISLLYYVNEELKKEKVAETGNLSYQVAGTRFENRSFPARSLKALHFPRKAENDLFVFTVAQASLAPSKTKSPDAFASGLSLVAPPLTNLNLKAIWEKHDAAHWEQIYEDFKTLYQLKDLIDPLEEQRLKEEQEGTQSEQKG